MLLHLRGVCFKKCFRLKLLQSHSTDVVCMPRSGDVWTTDKGLGHSGCDKVISADASFSRYLFWVDSFWRFQITAPPDSLLPIPTTAFVMLIFGISFADCFRTTAGIVIVSLLSPGLRLRIAEIYWSLCHGRNPSPWCLKNCGQDCPLHRQWNVQCEAYSLQQLPAGSQAEKLGSNWHYVVQLSDQLLCAYYVVHVQPYVQIKWQFRIQRMAVLCLHPCFLLAV